MSKRPKERGVALVILMVVVIIATLLGIWGLSSSRTGILKAGSKAAQNRLQLMAEQGLQKALRRVQEIMNYDGGLPAPSDSIGDTKFSSAKGPAFLLGICIPPSPPATQTGCGNPACAEIFNTNTGADAVTENVLCNFLGNTTRDTQVTLVRKTDVIVEGTPERDAIFLVNSIAKDSADRRQLVQGVIVVPYDPATGLALNNPYIATTAKGGG